jgi:hypothetical protein
MRIVPITLRIARYSRAHALWPGRPKIHFEGKLHPGATDTADSEIREVRGTVQMVASGDVRWSIVRSFRSFYHPPPPSILSWSLDKWREDGGGAVRCGAVGKTDSAVY